MAAKAPSPAPAEQDVPASDGGAGAKEGSGCTLEVIQGAVRPRNPAIRACYEAALRLERSVGGRLVVELGIERGGELKRRAIYQSDLPTEVNACVIGALEGLVVPGTFDKPCVILYPFTFSASRPP